MKFNIILGLLAVVLAIVTCKNLQKSGQDTGAAPAPAQETATGGPSGWKASHVIEGNNPDTAGTLQIKAAPRYVEVPWQSVTPPTTSRRAYMATGWWYPIMAFQPSDSTVHHNYVTKLLKFREDQSFDIIENGKVLESGHWAYDEDKTLLYLSCRNTYFNNTWKAIEKGFRLVLQGNTDLNVTGIQIRLDNTKEPRIPQQHGH